jgi:gas vesicle protein
MTQGETKKGFGTLGIVAAACGGAAAGTIAALLLAPRSGKETRKLIVETVDQTRERAARLVTAAREAGGAAKETFATTMSGH